MNLEERLGAAPAAYIHDVRDAVAERLGKRLVGVWLLGSAALGDFDPGRSDLDIQAVSTERPPRPELERLEHDLSAIPCPVRGLEFVLYTRENLSDPGGPAFSLNLNAGPRMDRHVAFDPAEDPRFWFTIDVAIARQSGIALDGPPASEVFPSLPADLVAAALNEAKDWHERHGTEAQRATAAARARAFAATGRWLSKTEAHDWARAN